MPAQTTNYQCPACTGPLHFDGATGKLVCEYCGSSYTTNEIEAMFSEKNKQAVENAAYVNNQQTAESEWNATFTDGWGQDAGDMVSYNCTSCGAELICEKTTGATECPYCGNPTIAPAQFSGALKPQFIIPFKYDKKYAMDALKKHYSGKKLLPKIFTEKNHIEKIQGIYVPFWLYNGAAAAEVSFAGERVFKHREGNYEVTETSIFDIYRAGDLQFDNIPVDASKKMDDDLMDSLEPFDYSELTNFKMAYLPGYLADKYDVSVEECAERADLRAANSVVSVMRDTVDKTYATVHEKGRNVRLFRGNVNYALLPVWLLNTRWGDKTYTFAMNGQTGKFVGNLPMDKSLYWKWHLKFAAGIAAVGYAILWILALLG